MDKLKLKLGREGIMRGLPPGFRFQPTEEELVFEYLKCKVFSSALPASIIPEINLCNFDPWDLPGGEWEEERYLFSKSESAGRWSPSGYWKERGSDRKIVSTSSSSSSIVGMKKTLVFYMSSSGGGGSGGRTGWVMHEYRLISTSTQQTVLNNMEKWVLCHIFWKKLSSNSLHYYSIGTNKALSLSLSDDSVSSTASSSSSSSSSTSFTATKQTTANSNSDDHFSAS